MLVAVPSLCKRPYRTHYLRHCEGTASLKLRACEIHAVYNKRARSQSLRFPHSKELATFEGVPDGPKLSEQDLIEDGFESSPSWFFGLVAEKDGRMVGHAMCNRAYSSWTRRAFYIEDLYVRPTARRGGVARRLLQELCRIAVAEGVHRVDWHVLENNADALAFYSRLGARDLRVTEGRAALRLDRPRIEAVAGGHLLSAVKDEAVEPALNS